MLHILRLFPSPCPESWKMASSLFGCKISSICFKSRKEVTGKWETELFFMGCYIFQQQASVEFTVNLTGNCRILCSFAVASWIIVQFTFFIFWTARSRSYCTQFILSAWSFPGIFLLQEQPALLRNYTTCKWTSSPPYCTDSSRSFIPGHTLSILHLRHHFAELRW